MYFIIATEMCTFSWENMKQHLFSPEKAPVTAKEMIPLKKSLVSQWVYWEYLQEHGWFLDSYITENPTLARVTTYKS